MVKVHDLMRHESKQSVRTINYFYGCEEPKKERYIMASIKNITRKLVNAGFLEDKLVLMTEKKIRETYKSYKATKEEIIMIKEIKQLVENYDCFTHCIDDYSQQKEAESHNRKLATKFVEVANKMGINATENDLYEIASSDKSIDEAIEAYIKSHEIRVVSSTLTEQNGELTFVELSPEQKIQISDVLDDQLQDINYSSWFEEENGVFKLYGGWVDEDSGVKEEYYFNGNKLIKIEKEESIMKDDNTTVSINSETTVEEREETTMTNNTNNTKTINFTTKKEVITMTNEMIKKLDTLNRTMQLVQVLEWCDNIKNVHDVYYVKKDVLAQFLFNKDLISRQLSKKELKRIKRDELIANLREAVGNLREAGIITPTTPVAKVVSVGDFCRDNAPVEIIEEPTFELNQDMASKILEKVIRQADTNKAHNFISNWMLTSAISEVLFGVPLKEKRNGEIIEHWKNFSKEQNTTLAYIHKEFVCKSGLVAKRKDGTIVGYTIPAKVLVWGRHKYLNKVCVYKVIDKYGKPLAEYLVSVNGIKNAATGKTMSLTADDYNTLDTKCVFIR